MKYIFFICLILIGLSNELAFAQDFKVYGYVLNRDGQPLEGATVKQKYTGNAALTDKTGKFQIMLSGSSPVLQISFVGYKSLELPVSLPARGDIRVVLQAEANSLSEVIVSTGYQELSQTQSTGSFVQVNRDLIERSVSTSVIDRLRDVVPGLIFNREGNGTINIRGQSTLFANPEPLIVIDNFPYEGDIANINPNDVESITVLKDAAAASIWGARAGNGVIVITTKKGRYNQPIKVNFNSSVNLGERPDLFYVPVMSSTDYVETEKRLFAQGYFSSAETSTAKTALSPAVEILIARRDGKITDVQANQQLEILKQNDIRNDFDRYLNRGTQFQQYSLNLTGGSEYQKYFVSGGFDRNLQSGVGDQYNRISLNAGNTYSMFKRKLEFTANLYYLKSDTWNNNPGYIISEFHPYDRLADVNGLPLETNRYRPGLLQAASAQGLLPWEFSPLEELGRQHNRTGLNDLRINTILKAKIVSGLSADLLYQFNQGLSSSRNLQSEDSYSTRNQINRLTIVNADGSLTRPIPLGGIVDFNNSALTSHNIRGQLNFARNWNAHSLTSIGGAELRDQNRVSRQYRLYGYDEEHETSQIVDYVSMFKSHVNPASVNNRITNNDAMRYLTDRFLSYYVNTAYNYDNRFTLTGSGRLDQSNLFGVATNQKGVPLYSLGAAWELSNESFYKLQSLPFLKLRFSYGYNGNIDRSLSALTTALYNNGNTSATRQPFATIQNSPNPSLRWERVRIINSGIDFATRNRVLTGSLEYYRKRGIDLIGSSPFPPSSGITSFKGNTANTKGQGIDLVLNTRNINKLVDWNTNFFLSYAADKVSKYEIRASASNYVSGVVAPMVGRPLYSIYSYQWAGLDPKTGDPQGYVNGQLSKDYAQIRATATPDNIIYHGSAKPEVFGAVRNTVVYKDFSISANINFRFAYFFKRTSVFYDNNYGLGTHGDYANRWQNPGDESKTSIPSIPVTANLNRDEFYRNASVLVEPGDNIRFQDLNFAYTLSRRNLSKLPFETAQFYVYASNMGIIWKKTKGDIDPDYLTSKPLRSIALGLRLTL